MTANDVQEEEIIDFLEQHNYPTFFDLYIRIRGGDFSLLKLPLNEIQRDILMNDFFIQFGVDPKNYFYLNHFPGGGNVFSILVFSLKRMQGKVTPITVKSLHDAALVGAWPEF